MTVTILKKLIVWQIGFSIYTREERVHRYRGVKERIFLGDFYVKNFCYEMRIFVDNFIDFSVIIELLQVLNVIGPTLSPPTT